MEVGEGTTPPASGVPAASLSAGKGRIRAKLEVKRADGSVEVHEAQVELGPEFLAVAAKITSNPDAQQAIAFACIKDPGVFVALQRAVGGGSSAEPTPDAEAETGAAG